MPIVNLTARYVETVKAAGARLEVRDARVRGLELRVSPAGGKSWVLRYRRHSDGAQRTLTLGKYPDVKLEGARQAASTARESISKGADPAGEKRARRLAETFCEVAVEWAWRHGRPNKTRLTLKRDIRMLRRHVLPEIGAMKAGEVTKRDVIRLLDKVSARPDARLKKNAGATRKMTHQPNRVFELVRSIFRWALGRDMLKADPTLGLSPPIKREKPRERELSPNEIKTLWLALDRATIARERGPKGLLNARTGDDFPMRRATALAIKLALATAQRIGEVTGIAVSELDLNDVAPVWKIPDTRTKNDRSHRVPLSPLAVKLIEEARELAGDSPWLFPSPKGDGPIDPYAPIKAVERARAAIGIPEFRVHDLRRTAATRMAETGISPHTISLVLNHVSAHKGTITGKVYVQYSYDHEKREALAAWGARLERIMAGSDREKVASLRGTLIATERAATV